MTGNISGGKKAAQTNKRLYGEDFFRRIGSAGGLARKSPYHYFQQNPEAARIAGAKGGRTSRRKAVKKHLSEYNQTMYETNKGVG